MIIRVVQLTIRPDALDEFKALFESIKHKIRASEGCHDLELLSDVRYPNVVSTLSKWESEAALEAYRQSELFRSSWKASKRLFAARPTASSHVIISETS
ncbi:MAG: antibiotic biosynthesis monooxygenase [Bacteroidetes Order II. Incertae sedis bacterium]|jgi:heme oxygenase (mycobilin-producing)|nr:antibiotic biosynthesis monooxygenase [Bacteroidetes Order II. bacterium]MBT4603765.1 antibiotic biosynthesis monooxygenase [Bacteroidetes Order II. bacterium]MBT5249634.1 antibiotic biosynthesis monooxygenase [Bacteroidetes Order II. bacterium]MBT6200282.1 antibiotic biosynthesis monooxygenase [Bacteroidetes Order II. bacterium]MBT6424289.1 antibiotic biosynthesis monooxygenase [Bacteroidetes Order II. bacterium]